MRRKGGVGPTLISYLRWIGAAGVGAAAGATGLAVAAVVSMAGVGASGGEAAA